MPVRQSLSGLPSVVASLRSRENPTGRVDDGQQRPLGGRGPARRRRARIGEHQEPAYSATPARRPKRTASVRLPAFTSVSRSRTLLTTSTAVAMAPTGTRRATPAGDCAGLHEDGAADGDEAEEDHHEDIAEPVVAEGEWPSGVRDGREDREEPDHHDGPAGDRRQVHPGEDRERHSDDDADAHLPRREQAGLHGARGPEALVGVGALLVVEDVVGEVGGDLGSCRRRRAQRARGPHGARPTPGRPRCRPAPGRAPP